MTWVYFVYIFICRSRFIHDHQTLDKISVCAIHVGFEQDDVFLWVVSPSCGHPWYKLRFLLWSEPADVSVKKPEVNFEKVRLHFFGEKLNFLNRGSHLFYIINEKCTLNKFFFFFFKKQKQFIKEQRSSSNKSFSMLEEPWNDGKLWRNVNGKNKNSNNLQIKPNISPIINTVKVRTLQE